jgi:hypothetical protein
MAELSEHAYGDVGPVQVQAAYMLSDIISFSELHLLDRVLSYIIHVFLWQEHD